MRGSGAAAPSDGTVAAGENIRPPDTRPTHPRCEDDPGRRNPRRAPATMTQKVAVLGTGKIGEALLSGMIRAGWAPADLLVTARRPERAEELRTRYGVDAGHQRRGRQDRRHPDPHGQAAGHGHAPRRTRPARPRRPPGHQRRRRHHHHVHRGAPHRRHPGRPRHDEHPGPRRRGHVRHLRRQPRHRRAPRPRRGDLRRRRQDAPRPRVPAGRLPPPSPARARRTSTSSSRP